jgi:hypothetical protein
MTKGSTIAYAIASLSYETVWYALQRSSFKFHSLAKYTIDSHDSEVFFYDWTKALEDSQ